jgi:hypothetical protein
MASPIWPSEKASVPPETRSATPPKPMNAPMIRDVVSFSARNIALRNSMKNVDVLISS